MIKLKYEDNFLGSTPDITVSMPIHSDRGEVVHIIEQFLKMSGVLNSGDSLIAVINEEDEVDYEYDDEKEDLSYDE